MKNGEQKKYSAKACYILVASDVQRNMFSMPSGMELAMHRLNIRMWGLNSSTAFRRKIKQGDKAIVYISGRRENAGHVVASCTFASDARPCSLKLRREIDDPKGIGYMMPEYYVKLSEINIFSRRPKIKTLACDLEFIPDATQWWRYLQGGVRKLTLNDYRNICSQGIAPNSYSD
jgi:hypothetical protein